MNTANASSDDPDETVTNALISVQGNLDEVSVIDHVKNLEK